MKFGAFAEHVDGMPWANLYIGPSHEVVAQWNIAGVPRYYILDANGIIRYKSAKFDAAAEQAIIRLVGEN